MDDERFSLFSSWDWAKRNGIPDPFEHPRFSTGTVWRPGDPNIWGYWPSDCFRQPVTQLDFIKTL